MAVSKRAQAFADAYNKKQGINTNTNTAPATQGSGFGGYTPSGKVTNALDSIANGSYLNAAAAQNPFSYDKNETNPYADYLNPMQTKNEFAQSMISQGKTAVTPDDIEKGYLDYTNDYNTNSEKAKAWEDERADLIQKSKQWDDLYGSMDYTGKEGLRYLADQGFSDDDLAYIFNTMYTDPRFENIVGNTKDSGGNYLDIANEYFNFMNGEDLGPIEGSTDHLYSGGYQNILDQAKAMTNPERPEGEPIEGSSEQEVANAAEEYGLDTGTVKNMEQLAGKSFEDMSDVERTYWLAEYDWRSFYQQAKMEYQALRQQEGNYTEGVGYADKESGGNYGEGLQAYIMKRMEKFPDVQRAYETIRENQSEIDNPSKAPEESAKDEALTAADTNIGMKHLVGDNPELWASGGSGANPTEEKSALQELKETREQNKARNAEYANIISNLDKVDFNANPFQPRGKELAEYNTYEDAAMIARTMNYEPNTPEYAAKVKELFEDIMANGESRYLNYLG